MREILACTLGVILLFTGLFLGINSLLSIDCKNRWSDYEHRYSLLGGCQVKKDGKWAPEDRVRAVQ